MSEREKELEKIVVKLTEEVKSLKQLLKNRKKTSTICSICKELKKCIQ